MNKIQREEWMTSKNDWDPSKFDDVAGASDLSISQFPPIPLDTIDPFYTTQGDIRATKSDLKSDSENEPVGSDSTKDPVVDDVNIDLIFTPGHMAEADHSLKDPDNSDSKKESTKELVVDDTAKDVIVNETLKDPVAHDPTKDPVVNDSEKKPNRYRPIPKKKKKKKRSWNNNKKIKWSSDTKLASFPTHLLPPPRLI